MLSNIRTGSNFWRQTHRNTASKWSEKHVLSLKKTSEKETPRKTSTKDVPETPTPIKKRRTPAKGDDDSADYKSRFNIFCKVMPGSVRLRTEEREKQLCELREEERPLHDHMSAHYRNSTVRHLALERIAATMDMTGEYKFKNKIWGDVGGGLVQTISRKIILYVSKISETKYK